MRLVSKRPRLQEKHLAAFSGSDSDDEQQMTSPDEAEAVRQLKTAGQAHAEREEWSQALQAWDKALVHNPPDAHELYELKAQVLLQIGRDFEAIQAASKSTSLAPAFAAGFLTLGRAQLNYGEPSLALRSFQRVLQIEPGNKDVLEELSVVQMLSLQQERSGPGRRAVVTEEHPPQQQEQQLSQSHAGQ